MIGIADGTAEGDMLEQEQELRCDYRNRCARQLAVCLENNFDILLVGRTH